jgi:hypothetical protein
MKVHLVVASLTCSTMDSRSVRNRRQDVTCLVTYIYSSVLTATIESNEHSLKLGFGATKCHIKLSCTFGVCGILPCARHQTYSHGMKQAISVGGWVAWYISNGMQAVYIYELIRNNSTES